MKIDYFITGMPRTCKAWLANYFTFADKFCAFEPFREGVIDDYLPSGYDKLGASDTSASFFQDQLIKGNPEAKWVILTRDHDEVVKSIKALGFQPDQNLYDLSVKLAELRPKVDALVIDYKDIPHSLTQIERHIGVYVPKERRDMLKSLNVSVKLPKLYASQTPVEKPVVTQDNKEYMELLWKICEPNTEAYRWIYQVIETALVWDHVVDRDPIDLRMTDRVFKALLTEWPLNTFWTVNANSLLPALSTAISNWKCSYLNGMSKDRAYSIYEDIPCAVAFILGGQERVDQFLPRLRTLVRSLRLEDDQRDGNRL